MAEIVENIGIEQIKNGSRWINDTFDTLGGLWIKSLDIKAKAESDEHQRKTVTHESVTENKPVDPIMQAPTLSSMQINPMYVVAGALALLAVVLVKS